MTKHFEQQVAKIMDTKIFIENLLQEAYQISLIICFSQHFEAEKILSTFFLKYSQQRQ